MTNDCVRDIKLNRKSKVVQLVRQQVVLFTVNGVCVTWFGINRPMFIA